jgi:hypothetical protein
MKMRLRLVEHVVSVEVGSNESVERVHVQLQSIPKLRKLVRLFD